MSKPVLYVLLLLLMLIWGFNVIAIKVLVEYFDPITITAFRILAAGSVVMIAVVVKRDFHKMTRKELIYVSIGAVTGILGHHFFLAIGLTMTTASNTGLIIALVPLMTSLFAILFLGDRPTILRYTGILLGFVGVAFIVLNGSGSVSSISRGDFYILLCVLAQAISFIYIKKATETMDARLLTGLMQIFGAVLLFIVSLQIEPDGLGRLATGTPAVWLIFASSAILATGLGHMFYNRAIHHLGAGETAIFINLTPFFSLTGSYLLLGEDIYLTQLFGLIFIVTGVVLGTGVLENKRQFKVLETTSKES